MDMYLEVVNQNKFKANLCSHKNFVQQQLQTPRLPGHMARSHTADGPRSVLAAVPSSTSSLRYAISAPLRQSANQFSSHANIWWNLTSCRSYMAGIRVADVPPCSA